MSLEGKTLFIANRGEIAVRVNRAAKALGMTVVQGHSEADANMLAVLLADRAVDIGPAAASKSYLDADKVVAAASEAGADAVHPGYGFLSENARFARAVADAGMVFVGPDADTIARMGDKVAARDAALAAGVPVAPGSSGAVASPDEALKAAAEIGYPVMIKASAGGGGRGIRVADNGEELGTLIPQASSEAAAAFGDGALYVERLVTDARHVEVQIVGDGKNAVHLFERECSLQRRRQKVWEEAPSVVLSKAARDYVCAASVRLAEAVNYSGAGTVEFLYEPTRDAFYFMEMNTRIQVEHPVTEMITGVDLVQEMISVAFGAPLSIRQDMLAIDGHAIEVRVNAEDAANDFMPFPGVTGAMTLPADARFDTMLFEGYAIPPFYDSLLGKLIVHAEDRPAALAKLRKALDEIKLGGLKTTLPLFRALANDPTVIAGEANTAFLEEWLQTAEIESG